MRTLALILLLLALTALGLAQPAPEIVWTRNIGTPGEDYGAWMENAPGGGFILAAQAGDGTHGSTDAWLVKTNAEGTPQWSRMYGGEGDDNFRCVEVLPDGYIALGTTANSDSGDGGGTDFYLVKTDLEGNVVWSRTYGGPGADYGFFVRVCPNGGFILGGTTHSYGSGGDIYLIKTDNLGNVEWARNYGGSGEEDYCTVRPMGDGFVFTGLTSSYGNGWWDIWIVRINHAGEILWSRTFGGEERDWPAGLIIAHNGDVIVTGVTFSFTHGWGDGYTIRLSPDGTPVWTRSHGTSAPESWNKVLELPNGDLFFSGLQNYAPYNFWVMRTNAEGDPIWENNFGGPEMEWAFGSALTPDGGYAVCGSTYSYGVNGDIYLARMAPDHPPMPEHHFMPVPPTGLPYAVIVDSAVVDNHMLGEGDEIGVFDGNLCVGAAPVGPWPLTVTAWQGDSLHGLPGFVPGHPMQFRVWIRPIETDIPAEKHMTLGNGNFGDGVYSRLYLTGSALQHQFIHIPGNVSRLISLNVRPPEPTAPHIFGMLESLVAAYQDNGGVFIPPQINTIGELNPTAAYRVFCTAPDSLVLDGLPVNPMQEYNLRSGPWHWISYPLTVPGTPEGLLASIQDQVVIMQDDQGHAWIPSQGIHTLEHLVPGKGYMLMVNQGVTFHFGRGESTSSLPQKDPAVTRPADAPQPTGLPYAVVIHAGQALRNQGAHTIDLMDGDLCVGKEFVPAESTFLVTAWEGLPDYHLTGFTSGHAISVVVRDAAGTVIPVRTDGATQAFGSGAYAELTLDAASAAVPSAFVVGEGFPNPFNPSVSVPFTIAEAGPVQIRVYNTLGQTLLESRAEYTAGDHRFTFNTSELSESPVSGLYFIQLRYADHSQIRKVLLVR